ncbi:Gfo/Idh/MocA family protein [Aspergillus candidus]|uniref:Quinate utilization oxidoreductase QutH n=1 Tax=Aspergillus candidus TaxID=41067 RepID=A0A2I2F471_ASPCN|nr:hypothetical protein BDW47DRAFT_133449 [Aspergillus candidus]PLB35439.1 hypothetical protein BDW47DRAFT_133449 [Aspergillus candidus]
MTLKFIIVGAGLIGPRHAQSILSNPSTDLVALIDPLPSAATTAQKLGTSYYPTIEATLQAIPKPDAAIVCTPNHTHVAITKQLLLADIHVLVEKPLGDNIASARELLTLLHQPQHSHLKLLVGHHRRFNPYVLKTKEILTSETNSLGHIIAINGLWTLLKPPSYFSAPTAWRASSTTGGGVIPINLIHDIDILHYLLGPITRVHAEQTPPQRTNPADEGAAITLRFASGAVGTFLVCDATPSPHNFEAGTGENPLIPRVEGGGADFYRIFGSRASLSVPDMTRWSYDGCGEGGWGERLGVERFEVEEGRRPFDEQVRHFVDVILGRAEVGCSGEEGLRALLVCGAVRESLDTGVPVDVDVDVGAF